MREVDPQSDRKGFLNLHANGFWQEKGMLRPRLLWERTYVFPGQITSLELCRRDEENVHVQNRNWGKAVERLAEKQ